MISLTEKICIKLLTEFGGICWYSVEQCMDEMWSFLRALGFQNIDYKASSMYHNSERIFSVEFSREDRCAYAVCSIRTYRRNDLKKVYTLQDADFLTEAYLDAEQKIYDYGTETVTGCDLFDTKTTGIPFYNDILKNSSRMEKDHNLVGRIIQLTPEEYYNECAKHIFDTTSESLKRQRAADTRVIEHLVSVITKWKRKFPLTYINYAQKGQEGLHRMMVAGDLCGWNTKFPVLVIKFADEQRAKREQEAAYKQDVERRIDRAIRNASFYKYYNLEELKDQLISSIEEEFQYIDELEGTPVNVTLTRTENDDGFEVLVNGRFEGIWDDSHIQWRESEESSDLFNIDEIDDDLEYLIGDF